MKMNFPFFNEALGKRVQNKKEEQLKQEKMIDVQAFPLEIQELIGQLEKNQAAQKKLHEEISRFHSGHDMHEHLFERSDVEKIQQRGNFEDWQQQELELVETESKIQEALRKKVSELGREVIGKYNNYLENKKERRQVIEPFDASAN